MKKMAHIQTVQRMLYMEKDKTHIVYILECNDGSLYTGYTNDLPNRIAMHESGKGAKYTRGRGPFILRSTDSFLTKEEAMRHEYLIKQWSRVRKLAYIEDKEAKALERKGDRDGTTK